MVRPSTILVVVSTPVSDLLPPSVFLYADVGISALWDDDGVKTWFFPRSSIPSDIANGAPQPTSWGEPIASFPSTSCAPFCKYFYQHTAIFDTTLWCVFPFVTDVTLANVPPQW